MSDVLVTGTPPPIDRLIYSPETVEQALVYDFARELRGTLGAMLVRPNFSATEVPDAFCTKLADTAPNIVDIVLEREARWHGERVRPLHRLLGELAVAGEDRTRLRPDDVFIADLQRQVQGLPYDFGELEEYHGVWAETPIVGLLRNVHTLSRTARVNPSWLNGVYHLVVDAANNPQEYTPPTDSPAALMLLCYVPTPVRQLTRRLLVNNMITAKVEETIGSDRDEDTQVTLDALKKYFRADTLEGHHWHEHIASNKLDQTVAIAMAMQSVERFDALATIQELARARKGTAVFEAWKQVTAELNAMIRRFDRASPLGSWQRSDTGHTFDRFSDQVLKEAFSGDDAYYLNEYANPPKTGGLAVVLEDDSSQAEVWRRTINRHTIYTTGEHLCFGDPTGIADLANNPEIGLFLLDIQNGEDKTAGFEVGVQILRSILCNSQETGVAPRPVTIRIWSASRESVAEASRFVEDFLNSLDENLRSHISCYLEDGRKQTSSTAPIYVEVRTKRWSPLTDVGLIDGTRD